MNINTGWTRPIDRITYYINEFNAINAELDRIHALKQAGLEAPKNGYWQSRLLEAYDQLVSLGVISEVAEINLDWDGIVPIPY